MLRMGKEKETPPIKLHADGNGGIYFDPEDILNDPEIQRQAEEFDSILKEMSQEEDAAKETKK